MRLHIESMECGGCARGVTRAIQAVDPAATVEADPERRTVEVATARPAGDFLPALAAAGFPATPL